MPRTKLGMAHYRLGDATRILRVSVNTAQRLANSGRFDSTRIEGPHRQNNELVLPARPAAHAMHAMHAMHTTHA
ncbi:MAG: hypothetical protein WCR59_06645, partial [Planctomycetota bacterium]